MFSNWASFILSFYLLQTSLGRGIEPETGLHKGRAIEEQRNGFDIGSVDEAQGEYQKLEKVEGDDNNIELFPRDPSLRGQRREPRTIFSKLHSAASFLTGLKLGKILSKKGFELGHGKIASSHTFQLFGKTVNSATSLAYGDTIPFLPALDETPDSVAGDSFKTPLLNKDIYHVTVVENPSNKTIKKLEDIIFDAVDDNEGNNQTDCGGEVKLERHVLKFYKEKPNEDAVFLQEHNKLVKEINSNMMRRSNSKF